MYCNDQPPRMGGSGAHPPCNCICWKCRGRYCGGLAAGGGGLSSQDLRRVLQAASDIDQLRSIRSFVENIDVAIKVIIEARSVLVQSGMVNDESGAESPVQGME